MNATLSIRGIGLHEILAPPLVLLRWNAPFRQMLVRAIARQYRTNALGALWAVMVPLITLAIYTFVFGFMMHNRGSAVTQSGAEIPFTLYLFAGLIIVWLLAQTATEACGTIVQHTNLVKKAVFPLEIIPLTVVGNAVFHGAINILILLAATLVMQGSLPPTALLFPLILLPYLLLLAGIAWFLAALGVFFRDLSHIIGLVMTAVLFLSPVFYSISQLGHGLQTLVFLNPVSFMVIEARTVLLEGQMPHWWALVRYTVVAWLAASVGLAFFAKARKSFADVL